MEATRVSRTAPIDKDRNRTIAQGVWQKKGILGKKLCKLTIPRQVVAISAISNRSALRLASQLGGHFLYFLEPITDKKSISTSR